MKQEKSLMKEYNRMRKKDATMPIPILEYSYDKKLYKAMRRICRLESKERRKLK